MCQYPLPHGLISQRDQAKISILAALDLEARTPDFVAALEEFAAQKRVEILDVGNPRISTVNFTPVGTSEQHYLPVVVFSTDQSPAPESDSTAKGSGRWQLLSFSQEELAPPVWELKVDIAQAGERVYFIQFDSLDMEGV